MITITTYKLQGSGADSWHVDIHDCATPEAATLENRTSREIVFEDPAIEATVSMANLNLKTMSSEQLEELKALLNI
jgi:hypothetical protein